MADISRKILMITNPEHGEIGVFLATAYALNAIDPNIELHLATFRSGRSVVEATSRSIQGAMPGVREIIYHEIEGLTMTEGYRLYFTQRNIPIHGGFLPGSFLQRLGFFNTMAAIKDTIPIFLPYTGPHLKKIIASIENIITNVNADLIVVDTLMTPALTACAHLEAKFTCLSPNSIKEFAAGKQPYASGLWKYPALFSGFDYPIHPTLIPLNIFFKIFAAFIYLRDPHIQDTKQYLAKELNTPLRTPLDLLHTSNPDLKILVSTHPELDFPSKVPSNIYPCGPIVRIASSIEATNSDLAAWLQRYPTIYVNLGSLCVIDYARATEMAVALRLVIEEAEKLADSKGIQVLWKWKRDPEIPEDGSYKLSLENLSPWMASDVVRVVDWVDVEPISILKSGHVVCSIHHGGANSYNEAIVAGVPQIILPQWTDCYDYAQRVEMLGCGKLGNRLAKPGWTSHELSKAISSVLFGQESKKIKSRAKDLAVLCKSKGDGASHAAELLLKEIS